jgi:hypothetical protein
MEKAKITWVAQNNSTFMVRARSAATMIGAVRAAREFIRGELFGEGVATIYSDGHPVKQTERSIHTGYQWVTRDI